jgi:hypothetical protein
MLHSQHVRNGGDGGTRTHRCAQHSAFQAAPLPLRVYVSKLLQKTTGSNVYLAARVRSFKLVGRIRLQAYRMSRVIEGVLKPDCACKYTPGLNYMQHAKARRAACKHAYREHPIRFHDYFSLKLHRLLAWSLGLVQQLPIFLVCVAVSTLRKPRLDL